MGDDEQIMHDHSSPSMPPPPPPMNGHRPRQSQSLAYGMSERVYPGYDSHAVDQLRRERNYFGQRKDHYKHRSHIWRAATFVLACAFIVLLFFHIHVTLAGGMP